MPRDLRAFSPSGAYCLEARVLPGCRFSYALHEASTGRTVWRRDTRTSQGWPSRILVDDEGRAVLHLGDLDGCLIVLDRRGAEIGSVALLGEAIPQGEADTYARQTTAGWSWTGLSRWYFTRVGERPCFSLRTYWGRRVVLGLDDGRPIADEGAARAALDEAERAMVVEDLRRAADWARSLGDAATDEAWW